MADNQISTDAGRLEEIRQEFEFWWIADGGGTQQELRRSLPNDGVFGGYQNNAVGWSYYAWTTAREKYTEALTAENDTMRKDRAQDVQNAMRREQSLAGELGQCADELAFWKYQAIFGRLMMLDAAALSHLELPEEHPVWRDAEAQLEDSRKQENDERASNWA